MSVYLDSSAIVKLVIVEDETEALRRWLFAREEQAAVTSVIGAVEVQRVAARHTVDDQTTAVRILHRVTQLDVTALVLARAAALRPARIRTLDALHVASAWEVEDLTAFVTYDRRMAEAAAAYGLPFESPGA